MHKKVYVQKNNIIYTCKPYKYSMLMKNGCREVKKNKGAACVSV